MTAKYKRRRTKAKLHESPIFLVVVDFDSKRFALEGPVLEIAQWGAEAARIQRAGRNVWCTAVEPEAAKSSTDRLEDAGFEKWPSRTIVDLPPDNGGVAFARDRVERECPSGAASRTGRDHPRSVSVSIARDAVPR